MKSMKAQVGARLFQKRVSLEMKRMKIILTMSITMTMMNMRSMSITMTMTSMKIMSTIMTMMNMKNMDITMTTIITMSIATKGKARMNMVSAPSFIIEEHHLTERNSAPMFLPGQRT